MDIKNEKIRQSPFLLFFRLFFLNLSANLLGITVALVGNFAANSGFDPMQVLIIVLILFMVILFSNFILSIFIILGWFDYYYEIDDFGVKVSFGVIAKKQDNNIISGIDELVFKQSFWGRLFNYGDVILTEPRTEPRPILLGVSNPQELAKIVEEKFKNKNSSDSNLLQG